MRKPSVIKITYWKARETVPNLLTQLKNHLTPARLKLKAILYYRALRRSTIEITGVKLRFGWFMSEEILAYLYNGEYEAPELRMIRARFSDDDTVMEVGTGIGLISTFCAKKIGSSRVHTFEGNPALSRYIKETFKLNHVSPNFESCLIGENEGQQTFYIRQSFWTSSTIPRKNDKPIQVATRRFNDELARIRPTFLILDIEGGEWDLCRTMQTV